MSVDDEVYMRFRLQLKALRELSELRLPVDDKNMEAAEQLLKDGFRVQEGTLRSMRAWMEQCKRAL